MTTVHIAGQKLIGRGWKHVVELQGDRARRFGHLYNNGWLLPRVLTTRLHETLHIEVIDGELPGLGVYVFCRTSRTAQRIEAECASASIQLVAELPLRDPRALGESFLGV